MPTATDPVTRQLSEQEVLDAISNRPYQPIMNKILVYVPPIEEVTSGGIVIASDAQLTKEHRAMVHGYLVAMGPEAWVDFPITSGLPRIGDRVSFGRFEGRMPDNEAEYRIMNDMDIDSLVIDAETLKERKHGND